MSRTDQNIFELTPEVTKIGNREALDTHGEAYDMYAVNGILFNHESPRRGETFVTRKITRAAVRIVTGQQKNYF